MSEQPGAARKLYLSVEGVDFDDPASIEAWAQMVWETLYRQAGGSATEGEGEEA